MTFRKLERKYPKGGISGVTIASYSGDNPILRIVIGKDILEELGWDLETNIIIWVGEEGDRGVLKLQKVKCGGYKLQQAKGETARAIRTRLLYPGKAHPAEEVKYELVDEMLRITLPSWAVT